VVPDIQPPSQSNPKPEVPDDPLVPEEPEEPELNPLITMVPPVLFPNINSSVPEL
jgi:hypothetical protein